jgi:hypothetical protein
VSGGAIGKTENFCPLAPTTAALARSELLSRAVLDPRAKRLRRTFFSLSYYGDGARSESGRVSPVFPSLRATSFLLFYFSAPYLPLEGDRVFYGLASLWRPIFDFCSWFWATRSGDQPQHYYRLFYGAGKVFFKLFLRA